jgi:hypothetical protein
MRYAVHDEDHQLMRMFDTRQEAERFCLAEWSIEVRPMPPKRSPYDLASRLGDCLF